MNRTGILLDLPVRTDTSNVVSCSSNVVRCLGVSGGFRGQRPIIYRPASAEEVRGPVICEVCGLPLKVCRCIAGIDY